MIIIASPFPVMRKPRVVWQIMTMMRNEDKQRRSRRFKLIGDNIHSMVVEVALGGRDPRLHRFQSQGWSVDVKEVMGQREERTIASFRFFPSPPSQKTSTRSTTFSFLVFHTFR
jgi:hypothetical protein